MIVHSVCPMCKGRGRVGFRLSADRETMVLLCDECAHVWTRPDQVDEARALDPLRPELARRLPGLSLAGSEWATIDEVVAYGWGAWITATNVAPRVDEGASVRVVETDETPPGE